MKDDRLISLNAAIDAMMKLQAEDIEAYGASIPEGFDGDRAITALKALPSAQPTIYGYDLDLLNFIAFLMWEKGLIPETDGWLSGYAVRCWERSKGRLKNNAESDSKECKA